MFSSFSTPSGRQIAQRIFWMFGLLLFWHCAIVLGDTKPDANSPKEKSPPPAPATRTSGHARRTLGQLSRLTNDGEYKQRPAWSPDGKWLCFTRHRGSAIFLVLTNAEGSNERRLTSRADPEFDAVWSPTGKQLAFSFVKTSPNQGDLDIYFLTLANSELKPFAVTLSGLTHEEAPAWSPDGQWIAFSATREGNQEIHVAKADGSEVHRLTNEPDYDAHPAWSPDGKRLAFVSSRWGNLEIVTMNPDGSKPQRLTHSPGLDDYPAWSPDGQAIAFTSQRDGNPEIYLMNADGSQPVNLTRNRAIDNFPAWTPDGKLSFVSNRAAGFDIYWGTLVEPDAKTPSAHRSSPPSSLAAPTANPGQRQN